MPITPKRLACKAAASRSFAVAARKKKCFSTISTKCLEQVAAILNARNQGSTGCSAKGADAERDVETIESDDEVDGDDKAGVDDEVVELPTV